MPALGIVVGLAILGAGLVISGIYILAGLGAALLLSGVLLFAAARVVRSGMIANG